MNVIQPVVVCLLFVSMLSCLAADGPRLVDSLAGQRRVQRRQTGQQKSSATQRVGAIPETAFVSEQSAEKIPPVDFSKEMIIAATMGTKRTGGTRLKSSVLSQPGIAENLRETDSPRPAR